MIKILVALSLFLVWLGISYHSSDNWENEDTVQNSDEIAVILNKMKQQSVSEDLGFQLQDINQKVRNKDISESEWKKRLLQTINSSEALKKQIETYREQLPNIDRILKSTLKCIKKAKNQEKKRIETCIKTAAGLSRVFKIPPWVISSIQMKEIPDFNKNKLVKKIEEEIVHTSKINTCYKWTDKISILIFCN